MITQQDRKITELSKNDIESLGFKLFKEEFNKFVFINNNDYNRDEKIYFGELYESKRYVAIENNCGQFYFMGWLKNKKELKKLLNQVGVGFKENKDLYDNNTLP